MQSNGWLAACLYYLYRNCSSWKSERSDSSDKGGRIQQTVSTVDVDYDCDFHWHAMVILFKGLSLYTYMYLSWMEGSNSSKKTDFDWCQFEIYFSILNNFNTSIKCLSVNNTFCISKGSNFFIHFNYLHFIKLFKKF